MNPDPVRSVLVLGARGRLGAAAATAFRAAGWRVLTQARCGQPEAGRIDIPLLETRRLADAAAGASVVVYAVNPPYTEWETQLLPLARAGMAVAEQLGATFMLPGNVYGFGEGMPALLREDTPEAPSTRKGALRQQLESDLAERATRTGLKSIVIRAGDFFGAAKGTWIDLSIAKDLARREKPNKALSYPGPLDVPHAWAYLPDLARAFVAAAERRGDLPAHARLHFEGHTLTGQQLLGGLDGAARELGLVKPGERIVHKRMNWLPVRVAGLVVPMLRELAHMRYLYRVPHALDGRALQALTGPLPHTPLRDALRATVASLGPRAVAARPDTPSAAERA
jgi:nucleoside-diphosphate-sugar epimerase